jgi:hypothetical protein
MTSIQDRVKPPPAEAGYMRPDILTFSGHYFDFINPELSKIEIDDIAHGLSNICRFGGQCREFYSVAQHSVLVSEHCDLPFRYDGLMHDAAEAFIGDIPAPLKRLLPEYKVIEKRVEDVIAKRFRVSNPLHAHIKHMDLILLATEQRDLMAPHDDEWGIIANIKPLQQTIHPWTANEAKEQFLKRYSQLLEFHRMTNLLMQTFDTQVL